MLRRKGVVTLATFALAIGLSFTAVSVPAASACKGLERGPCERKGCSWVESYRRKDGVSVAGHCKSKPYKSVESDDKKKLEHKSKSVGSDPKERFDSKSKSVRSDYEKGVDSKSKSAKSGDKKKSESKKKSEKTSKKKSEKTI
ncbi:hypothetical protein [Candidatus Thiosymbion oneisti]|uniref:hypothetical protein n=1 Tax=Candidatus Thiosymbion oneisti TaxID=589554 RepID=UPI000B7F9ED2|nr:hypothetical protein [Candidatus Thiosymbion oneisti]